MLDVITGANAPFHSDILLSFGELRYETFVRHLGWKLDCAEGNERDQFDTPAAVYLTIRNSRGAVIAGARLLDSLGPNLLCDVFPQLLEGAAPVGPRIYDITRFAVDPRRERLEGRANVCQELLCGLMEFGVGIGAPHFISVSDIRIEPILRRAGWRIHRLGGVAEMDGTGVVGLRHEVSAEVLANCRQRTGFAHALLRNPDREAA